MSPVAPSFSYEAMKSFFAKAMTLWLKLGCKPENPHARTPIFLHRKVVLHKLHDVAFLVEC